MFTIAILLGIYSYLVFFLGVLGLLFPMNVISLTIFYVVITFAIFRRQIKKFCEIFKPETVLRNFSKQKIVALLFILICIQSIINLVGALGPELGFDALWYHLTLPKLYLLEHTIRFIPGGLLYYSVMPQLVEMLYILPLSFGNEIFAKVLHFGFGILTCIVIYQLGRFVGSNKIGAVAVAIFVGNLVFNWESITAYVDLGRTFYEVLAFSAFILWVTRKHIRWLLLSAIMLGLAISVKVLAISSIVIFVILLFVVEKKHIEKFVQHSILFVVITLIILLPWFLFSYFSTGNPIYPFFTPLYPLSNDAQIIDIISSLRTLFLGLSDPISPLYLVFLPCVILLWKKFTAQEKLVLFYSVLGIIVWLFIPKSGGGRFVLPYLPVLSLAVAVTISRMKDRWLYNLSLILVISTLVISIVYRGVANVKYVPVIFGNESKEVFLTKHLNFAFGDFYDIDKFFATMVGKNDTVLLYGFHNLYYVTFPFVDNSWVQKGDEFRYIAVQNDDLPRRFVEFSLIYENPVTRVKVYTNERKLWQY